MPSSNGSAHKSPDFGSFLTGISDVFLRDEVLDLDSEILDVMPRPWPRSCVLESFFLFG